MIINPISNNRRCQADRGFTLIELLIVVAIIAILAAIAVPNFLEAQTRAKVSRVKSDMRSLVTALETYHIDASQYAWPADEDGGLIQNPAAGGGEWFETKTPVLLTTPISYISTRPPDSFAQKGSVDYQNFHYSTLDYVRQHEGAAADEVFGEFYHELTGQEPSSNIAYYFLSFGPDQDHDVGGDHDHGGEDGHDHEHGAGAIYDASNGIISSGDIHYMGPGFGFL